MKTEETYTKFSIVQIDAWRDPEGGWTWNQHYILERDIYIADSVKLTPRKILKMFRDWDYLLPESKGRLTVDCDPYGDGLFYEIQFKNTREPFLALSAIH